MANIGVGLLNCTSCGVIDVRSVRFFSGCSGFDGVRFWRVCSGDFGGKLVYKFVWKFVCGWWKRFEICVKKADFVMGFVKKWEIGRCGVKVLHKFCTGVFLCFGRVLHTFHIVYYNYYYLIYV